MTSAALLKACGIIGIDEVDKSEHSHPLLAIFSGRKTTEKTEHYRSF
jgi:hypothetical protein